MQDRFSIINRFGRNVSLKQFKETAIKLESKLKRVRPFITSELLLTTNEKDYIGYGGLTIVIPEKEEALSRREIHKLDNLNQELWNKSLRIELYIKDNSIKEPYMIALSNEVRAPEILFFYGQRLDEVSLNILNNFKGNKGLFQAISNGLPKTSKFAVSYAIAQSDLLLGD